jgi:hypothetical protein
MSLAEVCLIASFLVVVVVVARMLRAIRLLDGRVTLLQEQMSYGRATLPRPAGDKPTAARPRSSVTPIEGVAATPVRGLSRPTPAVNDRSAEDHAPGEETAHVIDQAEADAVWAGLEAEQERLRQAMGRDFQRRARTRSAGDIRGKPVVRAMSSQEIARKIERK